MIDLDIDHLHTRTAAGHGLRETILYRLLGEVQAGAKAAGGEGGGGNCPPDSMNNTYICGIVLLLYIYKFLNAFYLHLKHNNFYTVLCVVFHNI